MELREALPRGNEEQVWRDALTVLVQGLTAPSA